MPAPDIIVIGGSTGGLEALRQIVSRLPGTLPCAIFVVIHTSPNTPTVLPEILTRVGQLPAGHAVDGGAIEHGRIYIAPPNHHLLLQADRMRVTTGPRENRFRPAIDPLFRTAAQAFGSRVIGIILSGGQNDGTAGLAQIKRSGGVAIVQNPADALAPGMSESAIAHVPVDHILKASEIPGVVTGMVQERREAGDAMEEHNESTHDPAEAGTSDLRRLDRTGVPPSAYTCPECGGALWELEEGDLLRFRCHVGHVFTSESLLDEQANGVEDALWSALRALEENAAFRQKLADRAAAREMTTIAAAYAEQAEEYRHRANTVRRVLVGDRADLVEEG